MYKDFFEFKLTQPINQEIKELVLYAPRNIHRPLMGKLDSMLMNGMMRFQQSQVVDSSTTVSTSESDNPFEDVEPLQIVAMLKAVPSDTYDFFPIFCEVFRDLILSDEICKVKSDNAKIAPGYFDKMSYQDADRLMGEYIKNFFTLSVSL